MSERITIHVIKEGIPSRAEAIEFSLNFIDDHKLVEYSWNISCISGSSFDDEDLFEVQIEGGIASGESNQVSS